MRSRFAKLLSAFSIGLLIIGVGSYAMVKAWKSPEASHQGYTLVQQSIVSLPGKGPVIDFVSVRYMRSDNNFVETRERGGDRFYLAFSRENKFLRKSEDGSHLIQVGQYNPMGGWTEEGLSHDPALRKTQPIEWISGVKCYVIRAVDDESTTEDLYIAPSLKAVLQIVHQDKRSARTTTLKTVSLVYGEPEAAIFANLPTNLPIEPGPSMKIQ